MLRFPFLCAMLAKIRDRQEKEVEGRGIKFVVRVVF